MLFRPFFPVCRSYENDDASSNNMRICRVTNIVEDEKKNIHSEECSQCSHCKYHFFFHRPNGAKRTSSLPRRSKRMARESKQQAASTNIVHTSALKSKRNKMKTEIVSYFVVIVSFAPSMCVCVYQICWVHKVFCVVMHTSGFFWSVTFPFFIRWKSFFISVFLVLTLLAQVYEKRTTKFTSRLFSTFPVTLSN